MTVQPELVVFAIRAALRNRRLLLWLTACWLCSLLDEILVAFGALYLKDRFAADGGERSAVLFGEETKLLVHERPVAGG